MNTLKCTSDCEHDIFSNHEDVKAFSESMRKSQIPNPDDQEVFVWDGFGSQISDDLFEKSNWQQHFVKLLGNQDVWQWLYRFPGDTADRWGNQELIEALASPTQEVMASLLFRAHESDDSVEGSLEWLEGFKANMNTENNEYGVLIDNLVQKLRDAAKVGVNLYLEKISIIASPDPENPLTISNHLHRDVQYGHLEAAIASFYSKAITPHSTTLFFPDLDFNDSKHLQPITADKVREHFPNSTGHSVASGSLAVLSGKMSPDGVVSDARGALHVSPEVFFPTRRVVFLFRVSIV